jgi:hypothetical protein
MMFYPLARLSAYGKADSKKKSFWIMTEITFHTYRSESDGMITTFEQNQTHGNANRNGKELGAQAKSGNSLG